MIGKVLGNRYEILKKIGGGGMAEVYKAYDRALDRDVAVKLLHQQYVNDNDFVKRFKREANSVASLSHQNVVEIYDVGEEKNLYYIIMEYIEGYTLKELIVKRGRLSVKKAVQIAKKICSALEHAHEHKIVHRDIKPHNILIGLNGEVKVTDFGIARAVSQATITHTGSVLGSVHYLSPEQARGGYTDEKSDIYSIGIVLYEMLTGTLPFSGDSPITIVLKHLQDDYIHPKQIEGSIPQSVENVILRALVKDPSKRYSSAKELLVDLDTVFDPGRINEPKYKIPVEINEDEQNTMVIPRLANNQLLEDDHDEEQEKSKLWTWLPTVLIIFSLVFVGVFGFQFIQKKFVVPEVEIPLLEGKLKDEAIAELDKLKLEHTIVQKSDQVVKEGYIIKQTPIQGSNVKASQVVTLYVSLGKEKLPMPDVTQKQTSQAEFLLRQAGFKDIKIIESYSEDVSSGLIFNQQPLADKLVVPGEEQIILFVSKGKENFLMPDLIGKSEDEAKAILLTWGLEIGKLEYDFTFEQPKDKVYRQFPYEPNREVTAGDKVDLSISQGYPKQAKSIYSDVLVILDDSEQAEITIIVQDAREKDITVIKETISGTKHYPSIELVLMPDKYGFITVYKNDKLYSTKSVQYY